MSAELTSIEQRALAATELSAFPVNLMEIRRNVGLLLTEVDAFAWVFDMIEPRRAVVDTAILKFVLRTPLTGADFVVQGSGVCRVAPQLARRICELVG